ncbi:MAG TPA: hypothetical protein VFW47_00120 [Phenylobacterium sp.]|nr:hypothetical protein [Phenylobacterium sp.]
MKPAALLIAGALGLAACSKPDPPPPPELAFDCAAGFDALSARISAEPGLKLAPSPGEPYRYYNAEDGHVSYVVTQPGAPAHPAVFKQSVGPGGRAQTGCAYGDRAGYETFAAYLKGLAKGRRQ